MDNGWIWFAVEPYPAEKDSTSSIGMILFPSEWKNTSHVPVSTNQYRKKNMFMIGLSMVY